MFSEKTEKLIHDEYMKLQEIVPEQFLQIQKELETCTRQEAILMEYLYGTMPVSDIVNYSFQTFLSYAKHGAFLWEQGIFREKISEDLFLPYVVYHRINTEDIRPCRDFFYHETRNCLDQGSMEETIKTLNYWCASQATYRASDERTAAPMTVYDSGRGRCGEESTFTVSVLRSAGIPARQIYAPRWSHCDDNHAWVEVWCDGTWRFLGACEPEEVLNKGWFTSASSRAMLLHSRYFGNLPTKEEMINKKVFLKELNQTERYACTVNTEIKIENAEGQPVEDAVVQLEILNYSQFNKIAETRTDAEGCCRFTLGMGSMRVYACKDGKEASVVINTKEKQKITLILSDKIKDHDWENFIIYAPSDSEKNMVILTKEQKETGKEKLAAAAAYRLEHKTSPNKTEMEKWKAYEDDEHLKEALFSTLSEKDLLDFKTAVLADHLECAKEFKGSCPEDIYKNYILAPRIGYETMTAYRDHIQEFFGAEQKHDFVENPQLLWKYIEENIKSVDREYDALITTPYECLKSGLGSQISKDTLFVAVCRSLGIPARLNRLDGSKEYYMDGEFRKVVADQAATGKLILTFSDDINWTYEENYGVIRQMGEKDQLLHVEKNGDRVEMMIIPGTYEVITQNRLPNGNIYGRSVRFTIGENQTKELYLELYQAHVKDMLEVIPLPPFTLIDMDGNEVKYETLKNGRKQLLMWLGAAQEPTEHILNEMMDKLEAFQNADADISFITCDKESYQDRNISRVLSAVPGIRTYTSNVEDDCNLLGRRMYVNPELLPLIIVTDQEGRGVYAASGYNVGTADMLLRVLKL